MWEIGYEKDCIEYQRLISLPTYPEPINWSNHAIIQEYVENECTDDMSKYEVAAMLWRLQSELTEWTEYEIGKEYEFSDDEKKWNKKKFVWYYSDGEYHCIWNHIRPISISSKEQQAIELLKSLNYIVTK
jgi:hypothetical protein